jgi:hypothetical protein
MNFHQYKGSGVFSMLGIPENFRNPLSGRFPHLRGPQASREAELSTTRDGTLFLTVPARFRQITEIPDYWVDDIREEDTVIDIGANVGAFSIRAAKRCRRVVAVEPVTTDLLFHNIRLNRVTVQVIRGALGSGQFTEIDWDGCCVRVPSYQLRDILHLAGGCTFLKCDCEGAEWLIDPDDLSGIRRIEMELHQPPIGGLPNQAMLDYIGRRYEFVIDRTPCHGPFGHMGILHAWRPENK